jgi:hypothetical protein
MKLTKLVSLTTLIALLIAPSLRNSATAEESVRSGMDSLLQAFKDLQPYLVDQKRFSESENRDDVAALLHTLRSNFHKLESVPSKFQPLPGFKENIGAVAEMLDDSSRRFTEGKTAYAWWRLRKLPSECFACHATYKVSSHYSNQSVIAPSLDPLNKGRFLLATRQFKEAEVAFREVLKDPAYRFNYDEVLRSLLLLTTRVQRAPKEGIAMFNDILATSNLPEEDVHEVKRWIAQLTEWTKETTRGKQDSVNYGEKLITMGSASSPASAPNDVALLRGTAILHEQLEAGTLKAAERPRALYLLGFAYLQVPLFFAEDWAEIYLERCINEFPGSEDAKRSYRVYRDHVLDDYTGTGGTSLPDDIKLHLEGLRAKAYGEPSFGGMVKTSAKPPSA